MASMNFCPYPVEPWKLIMMTTYPLASEVGAANSSGFQRIAPVVSPGALRSAVDEELHGIFLRGVEVRRLDEEAFDLVAVRAGEPEGFTRRTCDLRQQCDR